MSSVASPQLAGGPTQSLSASCLYPRGEAQAPCDMNSQRSLGFGNLPTFIHATGSFNHGPAMSDVNQLMNSGGNSGPGRGTSSLLTDANSALSGGDSLRSIYVNADSHMLFPASPLSFSSSNMSLSGFPTMEGSSVGQQIGTSFSRVETNQDQNSQEVQKQGASSATAHSSIQHSSQQQSLSQTAQIFLESSHPGGQRTPYTNQQAIYQLSDQTAMSLGQETREMLGQHDQMKKRRRLVIRQDDLLQQHVMQQPHQKSGPGVASQLQWQDSFQGQCASPQVPLMLQQQRLLQLQQLQLLQRPASPMQQMRIQHQQLCQHLQQSMPQYSINCSYDYGACARRLMQFIMTQRHRPADNGILFWRKLVAEYFAPRAMKRWCLSSYNSVGCNKTAVLPMVLWRCEICGSNSGRGFEIAAQALSRLNKIKFDSGVVDELLFLETPREHRLPSGVTLLESKAVQESVYEKLRVVHEGQICVSFGPDMKIFSWGFCCRRREELLPCTLVAPQVNQLVQVVQKYQASVSESGSSGLSTKDLQSNCDMFVQAVHQLPRVLEMQPVDELGFPKRYIRCLKIAEVVSSMKDLMDFSGEHNVGPIESLESYPRQDAGGGLEIKKIQGMRQIMNQGTSPHRASLNQMMDMHSGLNSHTNTGFLGSGVLTGSTEAVARLAGYLNLQRQNSVMPKANAFSQDASGSKQVASQFQGPFSPVSISLQNQASSQSSPSQGSVTSMPVSLQSVPLSAAVQQSLLDPRLLQTMVSQSSRLNQQFQQHTPPQIQDALNSNRVSSGKSVGGQNANLNSVGHPFQGARVSMHLASRPAVGNVLELSNSNLVNHVSGMTPKRNDSFKDDANGTMILGGSNAVYLRSDASQDLPLPELVQDISHEISES
ncbi:probable transcriptional regulator SLK3 [Nymphaea colorata]|nr:probable transcriptional regulator SLK3 [Nymphaea colorata]XP_031494804.1 probable transcriptional regulator SLK3 [Nymphaea colorata]